LYITYLYITFERNKYYVINLNQKLFILILLIIGGLTFGCKKDNKPDFRDQYVGVYAVKERYVPYPPDTINDTSYERDTVIIVDYGKTDTTLRVLGRDIYLDEHGHYGVYHYSLRLWNDSISSYFMNGGLGGGTRIYHDGVRVIPFLDKNN